MTKNSLITIDDRSITKSDFFHSIDDEIVKLHQTGDLNRAMKILDGLNAVEEVSGKGKAKFLWAANEWFKVAKPDENFIDHVLSTTKKITKTTITRYIPTWGYIEDLSIPKDISDELPMRDLVPIASTLKQGYEIDAKGWSKIRLSATDGELRDVLRKIKGKEERKSARVRRLKRDGTMNLHIKNKPPKFLGFLNIKDAEFDQDIADDIEKIKVALGLVEE